MSCADGGMQARYVIITADAKQTSELCFTFIKCEDRFITTFDIVYFIAHMQLFLRTLHYILNKTKKHFLLTNWSLPFVKLQRVDFRNCTFVGEWTDCPQFL